MQATVAHLIAAQQIATTAEHKCPHKYPNGTGNAPRIEAQDMTLAEMREYYKGYEYNEACGDKKNWG
jgi:hypothetical protein